MIVILLESAILVLTYVSLWFILSIILNRNDIADIAWGLGYVLLIGYHAITQVIHPIAAVCYLLVTIWGLRLSFYLFKRNRHKTEDFRYATWRKEWGRWVYIRSFLQVYLLQGFFLLLISSPILYAASFNHSELTYFTLLGMSVWLLGFYWQSVGDYQLRLFIKNRKSKEDVLQTGLWKYSRHPNYFGEITMWWGIYLIIWPLPGSLLYIIGPLTITLLIRFVSGVPMLEQRYAANVDYQMYKTRVPTLIPNIFRKTQS